MKLNLALTMAALIASLGACRSARNTPPRPAVPHPVAASSVTQSQSVGQSIVICSERHDIGAPVVLWTDAGGYDAYSTELRFPQSPPTTPVTGLRYQPGRKVAGAADANETPLVGLAGSPRCLEEMRAAIDLFVVHYDVCGTSAQCFKILHDRRKLSVHFMLDIDGVLYQTMDVSDTAWHARQANPRSIGIEIANIGAYRVGDTSTLDAWYPADEHGPYIALPKWMGDGGVRATGFVGRPARPEPVVGTIQGVEYAMYDLTPQQYDTLSKLLAKVCDVLPRVRPDAPRDSDGRVRTTALSDEEFAAFSGVLGHDHVTVEKQDPGPAFDWERVLKDVRVRLGRRATP